MKINSHFLCLVDLTAPCRSGWYNCTQTHSFGAGAAIWNNVYYLLRIPTSGSVRLKATKPHVSPPKLMRNCLTWRAAAEEERLCLFTAALYPHKENQAAF